MDQEGDLAQPAPIAPEERLARFEFDKGAYVRADGNPRPRAFYPSFDEERQRLETSLFRIQGLAVETIWARGDRAGATRGKTASGYCSLPAGSVATAGLRVENDVPPDLHAVILGWPEHEELKLDRASVLAAAAAGGGRRR